LLAQHLPRHRLGAANGLIAMGLALGPAFGTYGGGTLMAHVGWRPVFLVFGLASMLWLIPWLLATREASLQASVENNDDVPSFFAIMKQRCAWGTYLGHFGTNYVFYFVISWLPLYLVKARGFSVGEMAEIGGGVYIAQAISAQVAGMLSDRWMRAGASDTRVRKTFLVTSNIGTATCMLVCIGTDPMTSAIGLLLAATFFGLGTASIYAVGQTLAGPRTGGKWVALQNCAGNLAGIVAPIVTGFVVDRTGVFSLAFLVAALMGLAGAIGWGLVVRRVEPVSWVASP
jgi:MFS family permease